MFLVDYLFNSSDPSLLRPPPKSPVEDYFEIIPKMTDTTRSIAIHHAMSAETQLFRLQRGTRLHIVPGASLHGRRVALYCNLPVNGTTKSKMATLALNSSKMAAITFVWIDIANLSIFRQRRLHPEAVSAHQLVYESR